MNRVYAAVNRYVQGAAATDSLADELGYLGLQGPVLILSGPTVKRLLSEKWKAVLGDRGISHEVLTFGGECTRKAIQSTVDAALALKAGVIMGAGGGKSLDTARAAAAQLRLPFVSNPTVASTDSPCSALSIIYSEDGVYEGFDSFGRNPDLVLVDTDVILRSPERFFVAGMGDALSTMFEADACRRAGRPNLRGGLSTIAAARLGESCYRVVMEDGREALASMRAGHPSPAFERVVEANTLLSGIGFESGGLAAAHGLYNAMTIAESTRPYLHGEKVAFSVLVLLVLEQASEEIFEEVRSFCLDVGLPVRLSGIGLDVEDVELLRAIAEHAMLPGGLIHNEPLDLTVNGVLKAMIEADRRGMGGR
ncbi:MAG: glycerol dehydrogenase [Phycisphaerae bacterium]|nr:glycerol dehydrogenase [Phycisphaerae bacterium]